MTKKTILKNLGSDFVNQIDGSLEAQGLKRQDLAKKAKMSVSRLSQIMNNPGNLTLLSMIRLSSALDKKIEIMLYN